MPPSARGRSDVEALKRELQVLSEQYSQKCLEIGALTRQAEEREHTLRRCQQEGQELLRHNQVGLAPGVVGMGGPSSPALTIPNRPQELHTRLSDEIDRLRGFIASQGTGNSCGRSERSSCELEVSDVPGSPASPRGLGVGREPDRLGLPCSMTLRAWAPVRRCQHSQEGHLMRAQHCCSQSPAPPSQSSTGLLCDQDKSPHLSEPQG